MSETRIFSIREADIFQCIDQEHFPVTDKEFNEICKRTADGLGMVWVDVVSYAIQAVMVQRKAKP